MATTTVAPFGHSIRRLRAIRNHRERWRTVFTNLSILRRPVLHSPSLWATPLLPPLLLRRSFSISFLTSYSEGGGLVIPAAAATNPPSSQPTITVRVMIKGKVQGVFYRNWTVQNAKELGLKGWVRNRRDGSVEALFSGDSDSVGEMEQRCRRGPSDAMVTGFQVFPSNDDPGSGFQCRSTV